ncbi:hypothetical protein D3C87_447300 [compost metagenome]
MSNREAHQTVRNDILYQTQQIEPVSPYTNVVLLYKFHSDADSSLVLTKTLLLRSEFLSAEMNPRHISHSVQKSHITAYVRYAE